MAPVWGVSSFVCFGCGSRLGVSSFFVLFFLVPLGRVFFDVLLSILFFFLFRNGARLGCVVFCLFWFWVPLGCVVLFVLFFGSRLGASFFFLFVVHFVMFFSGMAPVWGVSSFVCFGCGSRLGVSSFVCFGFSGPAWGRRFFLPQQLKALGSQPR